MPVGRFGVMLRARVARGIKMKCTAITVIFSIFAAGQALGDERAARLAGEILAYGSACPSVEIDYQAVELWATLHGVDIAQIRARAGDDFLAISAGRNQAAARLRTRMLSEVCAEALALYGPDGTIADDMLMPR